MNILYEILAAAGILFVIAMLLICIGLFYTPKRKPKDEFGNTDYDLDEVNSNIYIDDAADDDLAEEDSSDNPVEAEENPEPSAEAEEEETEPMDEDSIFVAITVIDTEETYELSVADEILIGRNPKCDVVIGNPMISSIHCVLIKDGSKLMVEDNNSTNGTMLNGKPLLHVVELKHNDILTLGDQQIRINLY